MGSNPYSKSAMLNSTDLRNLELANDMTKGFSGCPKIVRIYRQRYDKMASPEYQQKLITYAESTLHDPIRGLDWKDLLDWEHKHLQYTKGELPKTRAELPIDILVQTKGRCGEFALLYSGLLLANGYPTRLVIDCSTLNDKTRTSAGDHVWVEVLSNGRWMHVDPTEKRIKQPLMYALEWKKDVNLVYAVTDRETVDLTEVYAPHE